MVGAIKKKILKDEYQKNHLQKLVINVTHEINQKLIVQNKFIYYFSQLSWKFEIFSFFSGSNQQDFFFLET